METNSSNHIPRSFNETIDTWIAYLDNYTLEMLCKRPAIGSWSLGRVYLHLIDDNNFYIGQMKSALESTEEGEMTPVGKTLFANNELPDRLLTNPSNTPDERQPESKEALKDALLAIKTAVNDLLSTYDFGSARGKTEHPGFRFLTALEWLQFADMHMRHHVRQKKRIDATLFF